MENNQLFPFERNRYYAGKLLTSTDFLAEQTYLNNKRRFVNNLMFGDGVVCGLSVLNLDDLSIMLESGVAIDSKGREIVVENSIVKKLSAIEGFEQVKSNKATLVLKYNEKSVHPVYSVNKQGEGEEFEYNRISEGYGLCIIDNDDLDRTYRMDSEFFSKAKIFSDTNLYVGLCMPATVSSNKRVKVVLEIKKLSDKGKDVKVDASLQTPAFTAPNGTHTLEIHTGNLRILPGESIRREFWLVAQEQECTETSIIGKGDEIKVAVDGIDQQLPAKINLRTAVSKSLPRDIITKEIGKISLEMRSMGGSTEYIPLAELSLVRTENAYIIDSIREDGIKKYIPTLGEEALRSDYSLYFSENDDFGTSTKSATVEKPDFSSFAPKMKELNYATGVCEIPFGSSSKKGDTKFSGEIMHGLGKGKVFVDVAIECVSQDAKLGTMSKYTVFGNADLFAGAASDLPEVETAVKVLNDKGSFVIAAKLLKDSNLIYLTLRWVAIKFPSAEANEFDKILGKSIVAETPTVVLQPKGSHFFNVQFKGMEAASLTYSLTEAASGEITPDGIYTAPSKEGVYEIKIVCTDMPEISTYAYAVVKQNAKTEKSGKDEKKESDEEKSADEKKIDELEKAKDKLIPGGLSKDA